jgi:hypothetical protein
MTKHYKLFGFLALVVVALAMSLVTFVPVKNDNSQPITSGVPGATATTQQKQTAQTTTPTTTATSNKVATTPKATTTSTPKSQSTNPQTLPSSPTMTIASVQYNYYNAGGDSIYYTLKLNRLLGFSEPVKSVIARSTTDPTVGCGYQIVDATTAIFNCWPMSSTLPRPTSGTLSISVTTDSLTLVTSASYSFPPLSQ